MENKRKSGICVHCEEQSDRLFDAPLLSVPMYKLRDAEGWIEGGETIWWHAPGSFYPGREPFEVIEDDDGTVTLLPPETSNEPMCWTCWNGRLWPALHRWVANKPVEFELSEYKDPVWIAPTGRALVEKE